MGRFKPGECGNPSGRTKGSKNVYSRKRMLDIMATLEEKGCNPVEVLADLALYAKEEKVRCSAASELLSYVLPKLKHIDHGMDKEKPFSIIMNLGGKSVGIESHDNSTAAIR